MKAEMKIEYIVFLDFDYVWLSTTFAGNGFAHTK